MLVSSVGDWVNFVAMMALVYHVTHAASAVALVRFAHAGAILLIAPLAGVLVDRWNRKWTMVSSTFVAGVLVASLAVYHPVSYVYVVYAGITAALAFFNPARMATLPRIVQSAELAAANALSNITSTVTIVLGASIGGVVTALLGPATAFWLDAASFLIIALLVSRLPIVLIPEPKVSHSRVITTVWGELLAGYRTIWQQRAVLAVVLGSAIFVFAPATVYTLAVVFVEGTLHSGATGYGVVIAGMGIGSLAGAVWAMQHSSHMRHERVFAASGIIMGAGIVGLALSRSVVAATVLYGVAGLGSMLNAVAGATIIQQRVANDYQGRVFAANSTLDHTSVLISTIFVATLTTVLGAPLLIGLAGAVALLLGVGLLTVQSWATCR
jgi:MFS family permease